MFPATISLTVLVPRILGLIVWLACSASLAYASTRVMRRVVHHAWSDPKVKSVKELVFLRDWAKYICIILDVFLVTYTIYLVGWGW